MFRLRDRSSISSTIALIGCVRHHRLGSPYEVLKLILPFDEIRDGTHVFLENGFLWLQSSGIFCRDGVEYFYVTLFKLTIMFFGQLLQASDLLPSEGVNSSLPSNLPMSFSIWVRRARIVSRRLFALAIVSALVYVLCNLSQSKQRLKLAIIRFERPMFAPGLSRFEIPDWFCRFLLCLRTMDCQTIISVKHWSAYNSE